MWQDQPLGLDEYVLCADEKTSIQARGPDPVSRRLSYVLGLLVVGVMLSVASYSTGLR
jgi:hypothetical protein